MTHDRYPDISEERLMQMSRFASSFPQYQPKKASLCFQFKHWLPVLVLSSLFVVIFSYRYVDNKKMPVFDTEMQLLLEEIELYDLEFLSETL